MSRLKTIALQFSGLAIAIFVLSHLGVVGFHYLRAVENDPLQDGTEVVAVQGDRIELADGRVFKPHGGVDYGLRKAIRGSGGRIGVGVDKGGVAILYVRQRQFVCGTSMPMITIPVIPADYPAYSSKAVAVGEVE
jgi:hypothetical protein